MSREDEIIKAAKKYAEIKPLLDQIFKAKCNIDVFLKNNPNPWPVDEEKRMDYSCEYRVLLFSLEDITSMNLTKIAEIMESE